MLGRIHFPNPLVQNMLALHFAFSSRGRLSQQCDLAMHRLAIAGRFVVAFDKDDDMQVTIQINLALPVQAIKI